MKWMNIDKAMREEMEDQEIDRVGARGWAGQNKRRKRD